MNASITCLKTFDLFINQFFHVPGRRPIVGRGNFYLDKATSIYLYIYVACVHHMHYGKHWTFLPQISIELRFWKYSIPFSSIQCTYCFRSMHCTGYIIANRTSDCQDMHFSLQSNRSKLHIINRNKYNNENTRKTNTLSFTLNIQR